MRFSVTEPRATEIPVVVEVPHAGLEVDGQALATLAAPARSLGMDADLYVDELYADAPDLGATLLLSHTSRYVCDLNRSETDIDTNAVVGAAVASSPHGLIWMSTTEEKPALVAPLSRAEFERRLETFYRPYHKTLRSLLNAKHHRFGYAILLCAHSMPSRGRSGHTDPGTDRADVVPGSRGMSTAAAPVVRTPERLAQERGWSVAHDRPYRGGFTTAFYGRPAGGMHAIQVELARRLYMNETSLAKNPEAFAKARAYCADLVRALGALEIG